MPLPLSRLPCVSVSSCKVVVVVRCVLQTLDALASLLPLDTSRFLALC
jgi:hypothetical protein